MEQVTIVVPFYNVETYIGECLDSLIVQTHSNIEILCVDDCSMDGSLAIAEAYAANNAHIKIIRHEENKGLGGARNTGIRHASSDYICFLDSDDYVSERFVELLYKAIIEEHADVVVCNMLSDQAGLISPYGANYTNESLAVAESKDNTLEAAMRFNPGCTNKMYRRALLIQNNIFQPEKRYYEDVVFWLMAVYHSSKISSISDRLHYYRQRSGSIMNTLTYEHIDDRFEFIGQIDCFVKNKVLKTPETDMHKIMEDTLVYIMRHLHYGYKLITEASVENKVEMSRYYDKEIRKFSEQNNWPALLATYKFYRQSILLQNKLNNKGSN